MSFGGFIVCADQKTILRFLAQSSELSLLLVLFILVKCCKSYKKICCLHKGNMVTKCMQDLSQITN